MFKKLIDKIKITFKKKGNINNIVIQPEPENIPESIHYDEECFQNKDLANTIGVFSYEYYKCNKYTRYLILREVYGEDKIHLINILNRTKKFRVRKKLVKRMTN